MGGRESCNLQYQHGKIHRFFMRVGFLLDRVCIRVQYGWDRAGCSICCDVLVCEMRWIFFTCLSTSASSAAHPTSHLAWSLLHAPNGNRPKAQWQPSTQAANSVERSRIWRRTIFQPQRNHCTHQSTLNWSQHGLKVPLTSVPHMKSTVNSVDHTIEKR